MHVMVLYNTNITLQWNTNYKMSYTFSRLFYNALYNVLLHKSIANIAFLNAKIWVVYVMVEKSLPRFLICVTLDYSVLL